MSIRPRGPGSGMEPGLGSATPPRGSDFFFKAGRASLCMRAGLAPPISTSGWMPSVSGSWRHTTGKTDTEAFTDHVNFVSARSAGPPFRHTKCASAGMEQPSSGGHAECVQQQIWRERQYLLTSVNSTPWSDFDQLHMWGCSISPFGTTLEWRDVITVALWLQRKGRLTAPFLTR